MQDNNQKFVIFDLDGTLIDSFECVLRCVNKALDSFALPHVEIPSSERHRDIAIIFDKAKEITTGKVGFGNLKKRFDEIHLNDCTKSINIIDCTFSMLLKHYIEGHIIIILTNKFQPIAEKICSSFFPMVSVVIGRTTSSLTSKEIFFAEFLRTKNIQTDQVVFYYGDSIQDKEISSHFDIPYFCVQV